MRHHAPALRGALVHIGGHHQSFVLAFDSLNVDAFDHVVHGTGERFHFANAFGPGLDGAIGKHGLKSPSDGRCATKRGPPGCTHTTSSSSAQHAMSFSMSPVCRAS